jgi:hypothetical protein
VSVGLVAVIALSVAVSIVVTVGLGALLAPAIVRAIAREIDPPGDEPDVVVWPTEEPDGPGDTCGAQDTDIVPARAVRPYVLLHAHSRAGTSVGSPAVPARTMPGSPPPPQGARPAGGTGIPEPVPPAGTIRWRML